SKVRYICEVRSVIRFLLAKNHKLIEIFWQLCEVYGDNIITEGGVRQWCIKFKNGRTNIHDEQRSGRPSIVTDELVAKVDVKIRENRRFTVTELSLSFPQISRSLLHEIVTQKLGYHKFCARWVPKILTENHKSQYMAASLTFLKSHLRSPECFQVGDFSSPALQPRSCTKRLPLVSEDEDLSFDDDMELRTGMTDWLKSQAAEFYDNGITKLVHCYDKCLNLFDEYVEK
uniref:Mos1 transposase HTH domain-containing protein n=1 Tax=Pseudonaja textilis TaxID=8673 RepID=A0A670YH07_PSETE